MYSQSYFNLMIVDLTSNNYYHIAYANNGINTTSLSCSPHLKKYHPRISFLNQIVHKSKAAIVVDPNDTCLFSFGNMSVAHNMAESKYII